MNIYRDLFFLLVGFLLGVWGAVQSIERESHMEGHQ